MGGLGQGAIVGAFSDFLFALFISILLYKAFAFVDAACRQSRAFEAAGKLTKVGWLIILGVAVAADIGSLLGELSFGFGLLLVAAGLVALIVYMVDVRPALRELTGRKRRDGQRDGPYGPW